MSDETPTQQTIEVDGLDTLRSMGAPEGVLSSVETLIAEGKAVTASISEGPGPASVAIIVDGEVAATFHKSVEMATEVSGNEAIGEDPRLEHAPLVRSQDGMVQIFLGAQQIVQLLLTRGIEIPPDPSNHLALGCEVLYRGAPFERALEIRFPEPSR